MMHSELQSEELTVIKRRPLVWSLLSCVGILALTACNTTSEDVADSQPGDNPSAIATSIVLPNGGKCQFAGKGATLSYEGERLNYTCGDVGGLLGNIQIANGTEMTVTFAVLDGSSVTETEPVVFTIAAIELADGTTCLHAGQGATLAFDGKRLNYTCGTADIGIIGDISQSEATFKAEKATLNGNSLASSEMVDLRTISAVVP